MTLTTDFPGRDAASSAATSSWLSLSGAPRCSHSSTGFALSASMIVTSACEALIVAELFTATCADELAPLISTQLTEAANSVCCKVSAVAQVQ